MDTQPMPTGPLWHIGPPHIWSHIWQIPEADAEKKLAAEGREVMPGLWAFHVHGRDALDKVLESWGRANVRRVAERTRQVAGTAKTSPSRGLPRRRMRRRRA